MKAEAMSKISIMGMKINLDFEKQTMSRGVLDILGSGLKDDPEKDVLLLSLKECMAKIAKGNKLPYKAANYLLVNILNSLSLDGSDVSEEIAHSPVTDSQPEDHSQSENDDVIHGSPLGASGSASNPRAAEPPNTNQASVKEAGDKSPNKKKDLCRFYARGHCTKKGDCRFDHPSICKVFRQFGDKTKDPKGCDGKCGAFHPNVCHSSARDRTCTWTECRFFHLKGTKLLNRGQQGPSNSNWRSNQDQNSNSQHRLRPNQNQSRSESHSKNGSAGLNSNRSKKKGGKKNQSQRPDPIPQKAAANTRKAETVTQEEKKQLGQTLEAILKRLSAMETRQAMFAQPAAHQMSHIQPLLSPAVPPPGTQTQFQWASQQPWTQTQ